MMPDPIASTGEHEAAIVQEVPSPRDPAASSLMLFRLGTRWFAVDVQAVVEVALKGAVTRMPSAPRHILGITSLRGRLVTVLSVEHMLGVEAPLSRERTATLPRLVVVRHADLEVAMVADSIHGIGHRLGAGVTDDQPGDPVSSPDFARHVFAWQDHRVAVLDVPELVLTAARLSGLATSVEPVQA